MVDNVCGEAAEPIKGFTTWISASPVGCVMGYAAVEPTLYIRESFTRWPVQAPLERGS